MVEELTEEEQEAAARTSYAYWLRSTTTAAAAATAAESAEPSSDPAADPRDDPSCPSDRFRMAMREARRHYVGENRDYDKASHNFKRTVRFRIEMRLDDLRTCGANSGSGGSSTGDDNNERAPAEDGSIVDRYCELLRLDLRRQPMAIRGHDRDYRALLIKMGRTAGPSSSNRGGTDGDDDDLSASSTSSTESLSPSDRELAYTLAQLYVVERASACAEYVSRGHQEELVAVFDFATYSSANSPPIKTIIHAATLLQHHYPERLKALVILDAPFWMRAVYFAVQPFLSDRTKKKIVMVSGTEAKAEVFQGELVHVEPEHATPLMMPDGKLRTVIDPDRFLDEVPFHAPYDDDF